MRPGLPAAAAAGKTVREPEWWNAGMVEAAAAAAGKAVREPEWWNAGMAETAAAAAGRPAFLQ